MKMNVSAHIMTISAMEITGIIRARHTGTDDCVTHKYCSLD